MLTCLEIVEILFHDFVTRHELVKVTGTARHTLPRNYFQPVDYAGFEN
jgi:hypothetical protein